MKPAYALVVVSLVGLSGWAAGRRPVATFGPISIGEIQSVVLAQLGEPCAPGSRFSGLPEC